jgi:hypothetical protein
LSDFPDSLRSAMIFDVPVLASPVRTKNLGLLAHRFIQAPSERAEKLVIGREAAFLGRSSASQVNSGRAGVLFQAYRRLSYMRPLRSTEPSPKDANWNATQTEQNSVPLILAVCEKPFFTALPSTFVEGYRAKGMTRVESARIYAARHYLLADNLAVADVIEQHARSDAS